MRQPDVRARRREETRRRMIRAGQRLFAEQGFERTTVGEIASAAGVSRRTFFHYFAAKEDVVLSRHEDFERALLAVIRSAPAGETILQVAERAVTAALDQFDAEEARLLEGLKRDTPALRVRDRGKYERLERAIAGAVAERGGLAVDDLRVRTDAMLVTGVLRVGGEGWVEAISSGVPVADYVRRVVDALRQGVGSASAAGPGARPSLAAAVGGGPGAGAIHPGSKD